MADRPIYEMGPHRYVESVEATVHPLRPSILLADDDDRFRTILRSLLEDDGYTVVAEASDAHETRAMARLHRPDVVVLDLVMDGSHGLSTARELLADDPARPVVVISTLFDPTLEQEAVRMGAWYLEKVEGVEALEHLITDAVSVTRRP
jgi:DNA-binding NarL/FixJ family response regulator